MPQNDGIGELSLLLPVISRITRNDEWAALIDPPVTPYAPALSNAGVDLNRLLILQPDEQRFWAAEQLLRSGLFKTVIMWADAISNRQQRRLQLAAESGRAFAACYRPYRAASEHSAAALRLTLQPQSNALLVDIIKTRHGGKPCQCLLDNRHFFNAHTLH